MIPRRYRGSLAVWMLLLAYASLYPFLPLRLPGAEAIGGFFHASRMLIRSDVAFNIVAYVPLGMFVAIALAHIGQSKIRKATDEGRRHRLAAVFFTLALIIILLSIPWPGMPAGRPLLPW